MNSEELGKRILKIVPYSKLGRFLERVDSLWLSFIYSCEDTFLGSIFLIFIKSIWVVFVVILILTFMGKSITSNQSSADDNSSYQNSYTDDSSNDKKENCSVLGINLHGELVTYIPNHSDSDPLFNYDVTSSENVIALIKMANEDLKTKAILIEVDSGGGSPVAGEEIANVIKNSDKPVIAIIRQTGASASYWAISGAKKIFASKNSDVGSIGVTSSYLSNVEKNKKSGYTYVQLSIGKYKEAGNPDKLLTSDEKALFLSDMNVIYNNFIETVSRNRNIPINKVKVLADGSTFLGEKAKLLGLIDEIGGNIEVEKYLNTITGEKPEICWK